MTCDVDEEDVLGDVGEQEDVEAARHTGLAQHLSKEKFRWSQLVYN